MSSLWRRRFAFSMLVAFLGAGLASLGLPITGPVLYPAWLAGSAVSGNLHQPNELVTWLALGLEFFAVALLLSLAVFRQKGVPH